MSRSGFCDMDDYDQDAILSFGRTRGRVASAIRGKRGQAFLRTALAALDKMEDKRLAGGTFGIKNGCMCLMTSIATQTGRASALTGLGDIDADYDGEDVCKALADAFDIAPVLVQELVWENDEHYYRGESYRWLGMRDAISKMIKQKEAAE